MKAPKFLLLMCALAVVVAMLPAGVFAQSYSTAFTTAITYQNVGTDTANVVLEFYADPTTTTPVSISRPDLAPGASTSLHMGTVSGVSDGFQGSAILQSSQPILATMVQLPQGTSPGTRNRPLSNGFSIGGSQVLIATVLKNMYDTNTVFSIQNIGASVATLTIKFYNTSAVKVHEFTQDVQSGTAYYVDAANIAALGSSFNGSAVVDSSAGEIVGGAMELSTTGSGASAFEGVSAGATIVYMPSALCEAYGANTAYAVQNTDLTASTVVTVTYSNGASETQTVGAGAKRSFIACNATGMSTGFSGSAKVESSPAPVIAIGKAYGSGLSTAFVGASGGASKTALPYVRWASDANWAAGVQQRVYLTIQNIGGTELPAGSVTVKYIDKNGVQVGSTHTLAAIPAGGKLNSSASDVGLSEFGVYPDGSYGGGAIIEGPAGSDIAVVARVSTQVSSGVFASEDYSGMAAP